jgi:hypothetical protein
MVQDKETNKQYFVRYYDFVAKDKLCALSTRIIPSDGSSTRK